jgi:4'-phosphopantetheinyl transferase EntD
LFESSVFTAVAMVRSDLEDLWEVERHLVADAHPARQRDFAAGRVLARGLLAKMGVNPAPLLIGRHGAPQWPVGVVGSLSHHDGVCAVALARRAQIAALGIDVEPSWPLDPELFATICVQRELQWLNSRPPSARGLLARLIFSAKESAYKCQYPLSGVPLEFTDLEIELDLEGMRFIARFQRRVGIRFARDQEIHGHFRRSADWISSGAALSAHAAGSATA